MSHCRTQLSSRSLPREPLNSVNRKPTVASDSVSVRLLIHVEIPTFQVATACFSCSPPDLKFLYPYFIFMYMHHNHCHRATAHLQLIIIIIIIIIVIVVAVGRVDQSV